MLRTAQDLFHKLIKKIVYGPYTSCNWKFESFEFKSYDLIQNSITIYCIQFTDIYFIKSAFKSFYANIVLPIPPATGLHHAYTHLH